MRTGWNPEPGAFAEPDNSWETSSFVSLAALGGEVVTVFHSPVDATDAALDVVKAHWNGPIAIYPEAERTDYVHAHRDETVDTKLTPDEFVARAQRRVAQGMQVIGGCCGVESGVHPPAARRAARAARVMGGIAGAGAVSPAAG